MGETQSRHVLGLTKSRRTCCPSGGDTSSARTCVYVCVCVPTLLRRASPVPKAPWLYLSPCPRRRVAIVRGRTRDEPPHYPERYNIQMMFGQGEPGDGGLSLHSARRLYLWRDLLACPGRRPSCQRQRIEGFFARALFGDVGLFTRKQTTLIISPHFDKHDGYLAKAAVARRALALSVLGKQQKVSNR